MIYHRIRIHIASEYVGGWTTKGDFQAQPNYIHATKYQGLEKRWAGKNNKKNRIDNPHNNNVTRTQTSVAKFKIAGIFKSLSLSGFECVLHATNSLVCTQLYRTVGSL